MPTIALRDQVGKEAKQARKARQAKRRSTDSCTSQTVDGWELTVGIEIHAQLNTTRKLFSPALTSFQDDPNSHVARFDVSIPGSQPLLQTEVLLPAIRAALALNCDIQPVSRFDRKHYFWWDQPSGYQITQYYEPLAKNGHIKLLARDGIAPEDGESVMVRIKQVQLEQDTAKTQAGQTENEHLLDFNRAGVPLIEIITEPDIRHPRTAAVFVRKVQLLLATVDACVSGMEMGGLRADVNVSVRKTDNTDTSLGTRTEMKNLSTPKAVENAIIAERDRQISILKSGGAVQSETRGWTLGATETQRLRGKEGEVDYRYMPDPDVAPLAIGPDVVEALRTSLPMMPDMEFDSLMTDYGLTQKDAGLLLMRNNNDSRVEYFYRVLHLLHQRMQTELDGKAMPDRKSYSTLVANWVLNELGRLPTSRSDAMAPSELDFTQDGECPQVPASSLSSILYHLYFKKIVGSVAKELLLAQYHGDIKGSVDEAIDDNNLWFNEIDGPEYIALADEVMAQDAKVLGKLVHCKTELPQGKLMYLVGKMMQQGPTGRIDPETAEKVLRARVEKLRVP
ncbi:hypothetical protein CDD82_3396 [Ophiocordyceps australis]|uniref:Glutamyl-tRNA(Gln) amidotransferase subunit B, mitochondrial n=1 Tax=Ophiocordyceps australis TaxID=1399860 RepID=A0A2C5Z756_9HYPO|nr:hypothetical protein CDD82_3396 [Ophiocordyceps australis]